MEHQGQCSGIVLRPYQEEALAAIHNGFAEGTRRQLLQLPTGTGKTVLFAKAITTRGGRAVVLAHRDELIEQAVEKIKLVCPQAEIGVVKAERDEHEAPIVVASVQTLSSAHRLERLKVDSIQTLVIDEAHHAAAPTYRRVVDHLHVDEREDALLLGVTATPSRGDGAKLLGDVFEKCVYEMPLLAAIEDGYLSDLRAIQVRLDADYSGVRVQHGDYQATDLEEVYLHADGPHQIAESYQEHAAGRRTLVFTPTVATAQATAAAFIERGIHAASIDGRMSIEERRSTLARLRAGKIDVLANCAVLTEGFDEPSIDCIVIARPTRSWSLYVQMIGRGTRRHPLKEDCLILDVVGATDQHDPMTIPRVFGVKRESLPERTLTEAIAHEKAQTTVADGALVSRAVELFKKRRFEWVQTAEDRFALPVNQGIVIVAPDGETYRAAYTPRGAPPTEIIQAPSFEFAAGAAEDFARRHGGAQLARRDAPWRARPATTKQLSALLRFRVPFQDGINRGEASNLLTAAIGQRSEGIAS